MSCSKYQSCPYRDKFSCNTQKDSDNLFRCVLVHDEYHIHVARRLALQCTKRLGMSGLHSHYVATAASELANNLFFHTLGGGVIQFRQVEKAGRSGVEMVAHDEGPGIADIDAAMIDGFSTNGGLGAGLGGTQRLMDEFEISSEQSVGTRIVVRKWTEEALF